MQQVIIQHRIKTGPWVVFTGSRITPLAIFIPPSVPYGRDFCLVVANCANRLSCRCRLTIATGKFMLFFPSTRANSGSGILPECIDFRFKQLAGMYEFCRTSHKSCVPVLLNIPFSQFELSEIARSVSNCSMMACSILTLIGRFSPLFQWNRVHPCLLSPTRFHRSCGNLSPAIQMHECIKRHQFFQTRNV